MRMLPRWCGAAALAIALACSGCGGSLYDTPGDLSKGPALTPSMLKKAEEFKAKKEAMKAKGRGGGAIR